MLSKSQPVMHTYKGIRDTNFEDNIPRELYYGSFKELSGPYLQGKEMAMYLPVIFDLIS